MIRNALDVIPFVTVKGILILIGTIKKGCCY